MAILLLRAGFVLAIAAAVAAGLYLENAGALLVAIAACLNVAIIFFLAASRQVRKSAAAKQHGNA